MRRVHEKWTQLPIRGFQTAWARFSSLSVFPPPLLLSRRISATACDNRPAASPNQFPAGLVVDPHAASKVGSISASVGTGLLLRDHRSRDRCSSLASRVHCPTARPQSHRSLSGPGENKGEVQLDEMFKRGDMKGVLVGFKMLQDSGKAGRLGYSVAVRALARTGNTAAALKLLSEGLESDVLEHAAFSDLFGALCKAKQIAQAEQIILSMEQHPQLSPYPDMYEKLKTAAEACDDTALAARMQARIDKLSQTEAWRAAKARRSPDPTREMLRMLHQGRLDEVFKLFEDLKRKGRASMYAYNITLSAHARARDADGALTLFSELEQDIGPDEYSYGALTSALVRTGRVEEAAAVIDGMYEKGLQPNSVHYRTVLHGAISGGALHIANAMRTRLHALEETQAVQDEMTLIGLLRLASTERDPREVRRVWREGVAGIQRAGGSCSRAALGALAVAFAKCEDVRGSAYAVRALSSTLPVRDRFVPLETAKAALAPEDDDPVDGPDSAQNNLKPGKSVAGGSAASELAMSVTDLRERLHSGLKKGAASVDGEEEWRHVRAAFDSTLAAHSRAGDIKGIVDVLDLLGQAGGKVEAPTFVALTRQLLDEPASRPGEAEQEVTDQLRSAGLAPSTSLYNSILSKHARTGGVASAREAWERMVSANVQPDAVSFNILIAALAREHDVEGAWTEVLRMKEAGLGPSEATWVSLITAHVRKDWTSHASPAVQQVETAMRSFGFEHTVPTATAMIRVLGQLGMKDEALGLLHQLRREGKRPNVRTYNVALNVLGDRGAGTLWEAVRLLMLMREDEVEANPTTYNSIIKVCEEYNQGMFFFAFMIRSGIRPSTDSFNSVLRLAVDTAEGDAEQARELMAEMERRGVEANEVTFKTIVNATTRNTFITRQEVMILLQLAVERGARPRARVLEHMFDQYRAEGKYLEGVSLLGLAVGYRLMPIAKCLREETMLRQEVLGRQPAELRRMTMTLDRIREVSMRGGGKGRTVGAEAGKAEEGVRASEGRGAGAEREEEQSSGVGGLPHPRFG